jgi:hypothetical protein
MVHVPKAANVVLIMFLANLAMSVATKDHAFLDTPLITNFAFLIAMVNVPKVKNVLLRILHANTVLIAVP